MKKVVAYPNTRTNIKVVEVSNNQSVNLKDREDDYDTYPPPDDDFVYRDPYVTEEEMLEISGKSEVKRPRKPASAYFYYVKQHRCRLQQKHPR